MVQLRLISLRDRWGRESLTSAPHPHPHPNLDPRIVSFDTPSRSGVIWIWNMGAYRFRRERFRLGGMPGDHTTRNRSGPMTTANTQYAYAA